MDWHYYLDIARRMEAVNSLHRGGIITNDRHGELRGVLVGEYRDRHQRASLFIAVSGDTINHYGLLAEDGGCDADAFDRLFRDYPWAMLLRGEMYEWCKAAAVPDAAHFRVAVGKGITLVCAQNGRT